jgi:putative methyltransferase (TIGR04325 family)
MNAVLMTPKGFLKSLAPPVLLRVYRRYRSLASKDDNSLSGNYATWNEAAQKSTGYQNPLILEKTSNAILKVATGAAVYERDSLTFEQIEYYWPPLAGLMWVAAQSAGNLNVLDFGGSLGTTFFQNSRFLNSLRSVRWNIVEQPHYVERGQARFQNDCLRFYSSIGECLQETSPNVILFGSVLQYLEAPYQILSEALDLPLNQVIIDRTPFSAAAKDRLCVQTVPPGIYAASYPSWIFSFDRFCSELSPDWQIAAEFNSADRIPGPVEFSYRGMILNRRNPVGAK